MSDKRLKKDIEIIDNALESVCSLRGCHFKWNEKMPALENVPSIGVIAQEVKEIAPCCVSHNPETDMYAVEYTKLVPYLIECIKSLKRKCDELDRKVNPVIYSSVDEPPTELEAAGSSSVQAPKRRKK